MVSYVQKVIRPFFVLTLFFITPGTAIAGPEADLWERWEKHDPASSATVDHSAWDLIVKVSTKLDDEKVRTVDYKGIKEKHADTLTDYLADMAAVPVSTLNRDEQMAYWINLYNAITVKVIIDHYPVASIRDIDTSPGLFSDGPWGASAITVEGETLSLDDIEHRVLRPIWKDPRIHYAVNCASIGCPDLSPEAFTASKLDEQLDRGARLYVNHPRGASFDGDDLTVSKIYTWFEEDFDTPLNDGTVATGEKGIIAHMTLYATGDLKSKLVNTTKIDDYVYDWNLNDLGGDGVASKKTEKKKQKFGS